MSDQVGLEHGECTYLLRRLDWELSYVVMAAVLHVLCSHAYLSWPSALCPL